MHLSPRIAHVRAPRRAGFTLVEMLIVVTLMAILAAMALPRISITQYRMDANVRMLRTTLQQAQRLAITRQYDVVVSFDVPRGMVRVAEDANDDATIQASERVFWKSLEDGARFLTPPVGVAGAAGAALVGPNVKTIGGLPSVVFRRDGAASTDLEVYIGSARRLDHDFRAVTVVQSTGRTDWSRYAAAGWKTGTI